MATFNSKRFAKLAGLLKENTEDAKERSARERAIGRLEDITAYENYGDFNKLPLDPEVQAYINAHNAEQQEWEGATSGRVAPNLDPEKYRGMTFQEFLDVLRQQEGDDRHEESLGRVADQAEQAYKKQAAEDAEVAKDLAALETEWRLGGHGGVEGFGKRRGERMEESRKSNKQVLSSSPVSISLKAVMKSCDHLNECGCQMQAPFDAPEDEPQGYMLVQNLKKLAAKAAELSTMANHDDDAEPWVESKVNSAAQHIDAIYDYIKYGRPSEPHMMHHEKDMPHDDFSDLDMHVVNTYEENE